MKRIILSSTFLIACLLGACTNERDVMCDVVWTDQAGEEVGTASFDYPALDDADAGVEMCGEDQETDERRPADAVAYQCNCST
jgi:hypothetical protein